MKRLFIIYIMLSVVQLNAQNSKANVKVAFPDALTISLNTYYDIADNYIYSLEVKNNDLKLRIWDMWNGIPLQTVSLGDLDLDINYGYYNDLGGLVQSLHYFPTDSTLTIMAPNENRNQAVGVILDKSNWTFVHSGAIQVNHYKLRTQSESHDPSENADPDEVLHGFTTESNSLTSDTSGYFDVTGINIQKRLNYYIDSTIKSIEIENGNYVSEFKEGWSDDATARYYEKYTRINLTPHLSDFHSGASDTVLEFNCIGAALSAKADYLALLESDYTTIHIYKINESKTEIEALRKETLEIELSPKKTFDLLFTGKGNSTLLVSTVTQAEWIPLKGNTETIELGNPVLQFNNDDSLKFEFKKHQNLQSFTLNNRFVYLSIDQRKLLLDLEKKETVFIGDEYYFTPSSYDNVVLFTHQSGKEVRVYDLELKEMIVTIDLNLRLSNGELRFIKNSHHELVNHFMSNENGKSAFHLQLSPFVKKERSLSFFGYSWLEAYFQPSYIEKEKHKNTFFYQYQAVDPGITEYFFRLGKKGGYLKGSLSEGEHAYNSPGRNRSVPLSFALSITQSSNGFWYYTNDYILDVDTSIVEKVLKPDQKFFSNYTNLESQMPYVNLLKINADSSAKNVRTYTHVHKALFTANPNEIMLIKPMAVELQNYIEKETKHSITFESEIAFQEVDKGAPYHLNIQNNQIKVVLRDGSIWQCDLNNGTKTKIGRTVEPTKDSSYLLFCENGSHLFHSRPVSNHIYKLENMEVIYDDTSNLEGGWYEYDGRPGHNLDKYSLSNNGRLLNIEKQRENYDYTGIFNFKRVPEDTVVFQLMFPGEEWLIVLPDGRYYGSPEAVKGITYKYQDKVYPYEQFDLFYNRPDEVMKVVSDYFGFDNDKYLKVLKKLRQKRIRKMGLDRVEVHPEELPVLEIKNKNNLPRTAESLSLELLASSEQSAIQKIHVEVNGVPIMNDQFAPQKSVSKQIQVDLSEGFNLIRVYCVDETGNKSLFDYVSAFKPKSNIKHDLYVLAIGESEFQQSEYNLKYASKDAVDVANTFKKSGVFNKVYVKVLSDKSVVLDSLKAAKMFFEKASVDDEVIVFVAGHGVLDEEFNYYYAGHDMDFNNPSEGGIPYEILESLLEGIRPLKKLLIMDTCHSGEVDPDELKNSSDELAVNENIVFRSVGKGVRQKSSGLEMEASIEFLKSTFADLRKGTGATVISSAGGAEFAIESDEWNNGLFTYCLLNGILTNAADLNQDNKIMLSEIQQYLKMEVTKKSNGLQQPTSRIENDQVDFRVW